MRHLSDDRLCELLPHRTDFLENSYGNQSGQSQLLP